MKYLIKILLMILILGATLVAKDVATITALNGQAFLQRDGAKVELNTGDKLQPKDRVITDSKAKVQIIFEDETVVTVGKNSTFSIDDYLFEDDKEVVAKFGMIKGAMRTITGKIGKIAPQKFSVVTKTTTIGIRGTNFSVIVGEDGSHMVYCTYGAISVTYNGEEYIVKQGFYIVISADGDIEIKEFKSQDIKDMKERYFAKSVPKIGMVTSDGLRDNIKNDYGDLVIQDVTGLIEDAKHTLIFTPDSVIAGYSMKDALYNGTYDTSSNSSGSFASSGVADLSIDFGADTAILTLGGASYDMHNVNSSSFSGTQSGNIGVADGRFYGPTGNAVNGSFSFGEYTSPSDEITAVGSYSVSTSQTLY